MSRAIEETSFNDRLNRAAAEALVALLQGDHRKAQDILNQFKLVNRNGEPWFAGERGEVEGTAMTMISWTNLTWALKDSTLLRPIMNERAKFVQLSFRTPEGEDVVVTPGSRLTINYK